VIKGSINLEKSVSNNTFEIKNDG